MILQDKLEKDSTLIENIGSVAGGVVGGVIGTVVVGPGGAVLGALTGTLIENAVKKIGEEIKERKLSKAENKKVGNVYVLASENIAQKLLSGQKLREDGFFKQSEADRSIAEEVFERTLFAAQREAEEKKLPYYARMYANIAFSKEVTRPMANQIIKITEQLTYRQLLILNVIGTFRILGFSFKKNIYGHVAGLTNVAIASEIFELYRMSLLSSSVVIFDSAGINPSALSITGYGAHIFNLMELHKLIPSDENARLLSEITSFLVEFDEGNG
jgi:hypothetical protein